MKVYEIIDFLHKINDDISEDCETKIKLHMSNGDVISMPVHYDYWDVDETTLRVGEIASDTTPAYLIDCNKVEYISF